MGKLKRQRLKERVSKGAGMTKEELRNIMYLDSRIESKIRQLEHIKSTMTDLGAIDYSKDRVQTGVSSSVENTVIRVADLEADINKDINKLVDMKQKARKVINKAAGIESVILEMRYLENMKWEEIAYRLNYSLPAVYKIHGKALKTIKEYSKV